MTEQSYRLATDELRQFVERLERLGAEGKDVARATKDVLSEAKGRGYDIKAIKTVVVLRNRDKAEIAEEEAVLDMYREALGV